MAETARIKYVFMDVAGFTYERSVEAQSDIVDVLNRVVQGALGELSVPEKDLILIPTGDGMAIALVEQRVFDLHLSLALNVLDRVALHNAATSDPMRRFKVRIGLNENVDNLVTDINGRRNVAGHGISVAQRVMDKADGGQVLVSGAVVETLRPREKYMDAFQEFAAITKHGQRLPVYQYVSADANGLDVNRPSAFAELQSAAEPLTPVVAYYFAHAIAHRAFLAKQKDTSRGDAATILLYSLALDSLERSSSVAHRSPSFHTWRAGEATFAEQYKHYLDGDFWPNCWLAHYIARDHLARYQGYFIETDVREPFLTEAALAKLKEERPDIVAELGLDLPDEVRTELT